ncbi:MAG: glycosyltransferase family 4 protein, partial [Proteobacteria bacterium]|nr:glycosyltransferase family 4 protein [Burkholderiales bacterium]
EFIRHLATVERDIEVVLFADRPLGASLPEGVRFEQVVVPVRHRRLQRLFDGWIAFTLAPALRAARIDAFCSLNTKFPPGAIPAFTTVHGVEWYYFPQGYRRLERAKQWLWFQLAVRRSEGVITFAMHTRADILRIHPGLTRPVQVVPEGVDPMFRPLPRREHSTALLERLDLAQPYLLSVCSLVPRKNIDGLLRAFAQLRRDRPGPLSLALVGRSGWRAGQLHALADELGIADSVRFTGWLPDAELVQLYNQAVVFVYPSKYEGFGLPPLEAMACGVPVVTSERSATAEVARGAAILIDPDSVTSLAEGIGQALDDPALRKRLVQAGFARVQRYSWRAMAEQVVDFIDTTLASAR